SGMIRGKDCVIGNGVVVDPVLLLNELKELGSRGLKTDGLRISDRAHVVMPYHKILDGLEEVLKGSLKAGTTKRGIGPCYTDKVARFGIRMADLINESALKKKLDIVVPIKQRFIEAYGGEDQLSKEELFKEFSGHGERLKKHITDASVLVHQAIQGGKNVLFEGAQGTLLCVEHGIYPYGTSSNCTPAAAGMGAGIGPQRIDHVMGVVKAYTSRVGEGPFPTEQDNELGEMLRTKGGEFGTTTGRPRRCGWLDMVMLRYSVRVNSLDSLAVTKLDVLGGMDEIKVARAYEHNGKTIDHFPADMELLAEIKPVCDTLEGWKDYKKEEYSSFSKEMPPAVKNYLEYISKGSGVPVSLLSYGPERSETIDLRKG
ncbi:MAG: adenylosuccinate synthase, partial [Thermoplasmata archaeon]|nr:adenylosuccinate synthase [Thermoplasmata archaeon]